MQYGSFVTPGWSYISYAGWVSYGLLGGGTMAGPSEAVDCQMFLTTTMVM